MTLDKNNMGIFVFFVLLLLEFIRTEFPCGGQIMFHHKK